MLRLSVNLSDTINTFEKVGERARKRLFFARLIEGIRSTHLWVGGGAIALVLAARFFAGWKTGEWQTVASVLLVWLLAVIVFALSKRLTRLESLAVWDELGGWKDRFASALAFCRKDNQTDGELRHVARAEELLPSAVESMSTALPMPKAGAIWVLPLLALAIAISPLLRRPLEPGDLVLTDEMKAAAAAEAALLEKEKSKLDDIADTLDEEEKKELAKLQTDVDEALEELADSDGETARDVLDGLEARAKAAERLAKKLGAGNDGWASAEFLEELSQHSDTTDLAAAIKDKNADNAAAQSDLLNQMLDDAEIKQDTQSRVTTALDRSMAKANDDDKAKPVGEHIGNASRKLQDKSPKTAARDFLRLAEHFRKLKQREEAQKKLQELAENLRNSGSKISGSNLEKMQKLAAAANKQAAPPPGLQKLSPNMQNLQTPMTPSPGQTGAPQPQPGGQQKGQGQGQQQAGAGQQMQMGQGAKGQKGPVPGMGQKGQKGGGKGQKGMMASKGGKGKNGQKGMALMAPIPGMTPGSPAPGAGLSGSQAGSSAGGNEAGNGTTDLGNDGATSIAKATKDSKITAAISEEGDSTFRTIQGDARTERAERQAQQSAVEFLQVEELALDEASLPLSRRDHVLKYFTALRESFENQESGK